MFADLDDDDVVMIMDADSVIEPGFLQTAMAPLEADPT